jgi:hypothetical protein
MTSMSTQHEEACPEIGPICAERDEPPQIHDQDIFLSELRVFAEYTLDEVWSFTGYLPLRLVRSEIVFRNLNGEPVTLDYENIHHENETLFGVSDPFFTARASTRAGAFQLYFEGGLSFPLGRTEEDQFRAGEEGREHEHIQFGTGTYRPIFGTGASVEAGPIGLSLWSLAILSLYENTARFQAGHRLAGGLFASLPLIGEDVLVLRAGGEAQAELAETWAGEEPVSDGNRGRVDILVSVGASFAFLEAWSVRADIKAPLYTHVVNGQLEYPVLLDIGVARSFSF